MNTIDTAIIPIFFVLLAILVLWFIIGTKGKWAIKAVLIIVVPTLCVWAWLSLDALMGWPVDDIPKGSYNIIWGDVQEPNKSRGIEGSIWVWLKNADEDADFDLFDQEEKHNARREPRAYRLPYTREMHKQMNGIKEALKNGMRVRAKVEGQKGKKGNQEYDEPDMKFYMLPPVKSRKGGTQRQMPQDLQPPPDPRKRA